MNKTPLLEFVYNRKKTAAKNREAAVELRITFERKQKYMTTGIRLLPKHWHRGSVVNRIDARELNETLEKLMAEVRQVIHHPSNPKRRMPRMNNDHVSHYSEETNVETNAGIVAYLYRIVPHIHSAQFSTLYMGKRKLKVRKKAI